MSQRCKCASADKRIRRLVLAFAQSKFHSTLQILHDQMLADRSFLTTGAIHGKGCIDRQDPDGVRYCRRVTQD